MLQKIEKYLQMVAAACAKIQGLPLYSCYLVSLMPKNALHNKSALTHSRRHSHTAGTDYLTGYHLLIWSGTHSHMRTLMACHREQFGVHVLYHWTTTAVLNQKQRRFKERELKRNFTHHSVVPGDKECYCIYYK